MTAKYLLSIVSLLIFVVGTTHAEIYFSDDFESYEDGQEIANEANAWEVTEPQDNPVGGGIASTKQAHSGNTSAMFDAAQNMGFPFAPLTLPDSYAMSTWFYHDPNQDPQPDAVVILIPDTYPEGGNSWIGMGTRIQAVNLANYSYRDKLGSGLYEDSGIPRRQDWVNIVFDVGPDSTGLYLDGKEIYTATIASSRYSGCQMSRTPSWGVQTGEVFIDDVILAGTMEEIIAAQAVSSADKLAGAWGAIKK